MRLSALLFVVAAVSADRKLWECMHLSHENIMTCKAGKKDECASQLKVIKDKECTSVLVDAKICMGDYENICGKENRMQCFLTKHAQFSPDCQKTTLFRTLLQKIEEFHKNKGGDHKRDEHEHKGDHHGNGGEHKGEHKGPHHGEHKGEHRGGEHKGDEKEHEKQVEDFERSSYCADVSRKLLTCQEDKDECKKLMEIIKKKDCMPVLADAKICMEDFMRLCKDSSDPLKCIIKEQSSFGLKCHETKLFQILTRKAETVSHRVEQEEKHGWFGKHFGHHGEGSRSHHQWGDESHGEHHWRHHMGRHMCKYALMLVGVVVALCWVFFERRRRAALRAPRSPPTSDWSTGLFGNWERMSPDWRTCLPSFFFAKCQTSLNQAELQNRDCSIFDLLTNATGVGMFVNIFRNRQTLRQKYDMPEENCADCCATLCCTGCAVAQNTREIDVRMGVAQGSHFSYRQELSEEPTFADVNKPNQAPISDLV